MSLLIWLPLTGDLHNQGLKNLPAPSADTFTYTTGKIGQCGTGRAAWHLTEEILENSWSVAMWVNPSSLSSNNNILFCKNSTSSTDCQIYFSIISTTQLNIGVNGPSSSVNATGQTFSLDTWYHVAATYDGTTATVYLNGNKLKSGTVTTAMPTNRLNININGRSTNAANTGTTGGFTGLFNDFRLYNNCLSEKEIKKISQGLVLHYQLNQTNQNLLTKETYLTTPWVDAIQAHEIYEGKYAYRVANNILYTKSGQGANNIFPEIIYEANTQYVISVDWRDDYRTDNKNSSLYIKFHYTDNSANSIISPANSKHEWTHSVLKSTAGKTVDKVTTTYGNGGQLYVTNLKLEKGTIETHYTNNNSNIIYDSSGYNNNGEIINAIQIQKSPKYNLTSLLSGSSSYIKVLENKWMPQHTRELTINLWAKAATWPTSGHIFSCTESGGFNTEGGNSGYWRFPVYVCTNEAQTSYAYKYDSKEIQLSALPINEWVMLTFVYDSTGTRTYINGQLHHTYTNTSYGIHFNMNARLFLGCEANTASPSSPYFNGEESDFRIYVTALTSAQIKELYETSKIVDGTTVKARDLEVSA